MRRKINIKDLKINFIPTNGTEFYTDFWDAKGKCKVESVLESCYSNGCYKTTMFKADIVKDKCPIRGINDGLVRFRYVDDDINFYGIQEVKRDLNRFTADYYYQILQALCYAIQYENDKEISVLILPSANYYDIIYIRENKKVINEYKPIIIDLLYHEGSPCEIAKNKRLKSMISELKIHYLDMPDLKLDNVFKNIYSYCTNGIKTK